MKDGPSVARIAALVGDHARAEILTALMSGEALTATELASVAGVTKQTVSAHLAKLLDGGLLAMQSQGRHRYFRLADRDVAQLLETLMGVAYRTGAVRVRPSAREPALRKARVCYDHLAGRLSVDLTDSFVARQYLVFEGSEAAEITTAGVRSFKGFGVDLPAHRSTRLCLDWTERRPHLAGALGAALTRRYFDLGWMERVKRSHAVIVTPVGRQGFQKTFDVDAAGPE